MASKRRSLFFFPLIVLACALIGGTYGPSLGTAAAAATSDDDVKTSLKTFTKAYNLVEDNFAEEVSPDKAIYNGAIPGMLRTLDPHSSFFDPRSFAIMREDQRGNYYGVGMKVQQRAAGTMVYEPFKGSPAFKAGLRPGDIIVAVNDKPTKGLGSTEVADMLKGPRGTQAKIDVQREGYDKPLTFSVTRDSINRTTVPEAISLKNGVWYIWIEQFNETTSRDLEANLKRIGENNIKGLVLDLRGNPGGLLNEGVATADKFLNKDEVIVSHRGRASAEKVYTARNGNHGHLYPIVVMVSRSSASAAEIVSGALQDHDRAWIFGDNTFGKGLVQTVFPLIENSGLALTTAKYYTPSGRLIQRDYSHTSFFDYYYKANTEARNNQDVKMTDSGRTVYGGGGISPDQKYVAPKYDKFQIELVRNGVFFNFTAFYLGTHPNLKVTDTWTPDMAVIDSFHEWLLKKNITFTEADFTQHVDWMKHDLTENIYFSALSSEDSRVYRDVTDPEVAQAVEALPKAQALLNSAKKMIVQRMAK
jgi:carboxyl-terminal processing protease